LIQTHRVIPLEGGINFRDLGGYRGAGGRLTRWHSVFRSGTTHLLTAADRSRLAQLGIRTVIDLRSNLERQEHPHGLGEIELLYWNYDHDRVGGDLRQLIGDPNVGATHLRAAMIDLYRELPYQFSELYRQLFEILSAGRLPLVFNCAAGKDRTGVGAALLLTALGVDWEEVMSDYLLTQKFVPDIIRNFRRSKSGKGLQLASHNDLAPVFGVDRAYLEAMHTAIIARNGSIENYFFSQLNLDSNVLEALRERLLE
jgi:protein-tyrosine phosphatase